MKTSDLRAAAQLASAATLGLVALVEAVHARVAQTATLGLSAPKPSMGEQGTKTRGITGQVYSAVRGVTKAVAGSADAALGSLQSLLQGQPDLAALPSRERLAVLAALNGVLGDHLAATGNSLATPMSLQLAGGDSQPALGTHSAAELARQVPHASARLLVLVHGLCMNDLQWFAPPAANGETASTTLQSPLINALDGLGYTAVALRYNSGLHISDNGEQLATQLQQLVAAWPVPLQSLALVGHSMGGLVSRSAVHHAQQAGLAWVQQLTHLVSLGSPHQGAPLERAGHGVDVLLAATPYSRPFAALSRLRSAGITSLRYGSVVKPAVKPAAKPATKQEGGAQGVHVPLPSGVRCCALAATLQAAEKTAYSCAAQPKKGAALRQAKNALHQMHQLLGDGLVPVASALGLHPKPGMDLGFLPNNQYVVHSTGHLQLLQSPEVAAQLRLWLA